MSVIEEKEPQSPAKAACNAQEANLAQEEDFEDETMEKGEVEKANNSASARLASLSHHLKTNSLKRSIALMPKNPFAKASNGSLSKKAKPSKDKENLEEVVSSADEMNYFNAKNVKKFFTRFVSHIQLPNARGRSKFEVTEERLQEWRRRFEDGKVSHINSYQ